MNCSEEKIAREASMQAYKDASHAADTARSNTMTATAGLSTACAVALTAAASVPATSGASSTVAISALVGCTGAFSGMVMAFQQNGHFEEEKTDAWEDYMDTLSKYLNCLSKRERE